MRRPNVGEWVLWLVCFLVGGYVCALMSAFAMDRPGSAFVGTWGGHVVLGGIGVAAVASLVLMCVGRVHLALLVSFGQIVGVPMVLALLALVTAQL